MTDSERRNSDRKAIFAVVGIDTESRKDRVGVTRNLSAGGLLFHSASQFEIGEELDLVFRKSPKHKDHHVTARVVRALHEPDGEGPFRFLTAVQFDELIPVTQETPLY